MRRLLILIALVAGTLFPAAGAFGTAQTTADTYPTGIGIRLVDAPVATRDNPRARVYIIDHVKPGTTIESRIEVSNATCRMEAGRAAPPPELAGGLRTDERSVIG